MDIQTDIRHRHINTHMHIYVYICKCIYTYTPHIYTHAWAIRKNMYRTTCYFFIPYAPFRSLSFRFFRRARHCRDQRSSKNQERPRLIRWKENLQLLRVTMQRPSRIPVRPFLLYVCAVLLPWSFPGIFPTHEVTIFFYYFFQVQFQSLFFFTSFLLFISRYTSSHYFFLQFFY